ncbi:MAG: amidohydrolase family protein [Phycisphaerales bacterium]|nr:amidohydrolase family protein [Phycisphaerales bacterium]
MTHVSRAAVVALTLGSLSGFGFAQPSPATVIDGATILIGDGKTIDKGVIQIRNGKISAVGAHVPPAMMAETFYADGKFVTPGLIDVWTTLGASAAASGVGGDAADAINRYDRDDMMAAIRHGVTAAYVPAEAGDGVGGVGAVVRYAPKAGGVSVLKDRAALHVSVGAGQTALQRLASIQKFESMWRNALDYRDAQERYKEDLEEYEKKIKERAEKAEKEKKTDEGKDKAEKKPDEPKPEEKKEEKPKPDKPKKGRKPKTDVAPFGLDLSDIVAGGFDEQPPKPEQKPGEEGKPGEKADEKKEEIKKPEAPPRNPEAEALLDVIDGKIRVRVHAERPAEIVAVIEAAKRYNLPLVLEGASGARFVAKSLKKLEAPVVFGVEPQTMLESPGPMRYNSFDAVVHARQAGIEAYMGSGVPEQTPQLVSRAAAAVAAGLPEREALPMITSKAATLLGVDEEIGTIEGGRSADLVVWSGNPFAPGAQVERVYIAGELVYDIEENE